MAKRLKRAFTIVELVIVIAVIAILAAVLIPTFTTLIDKANESNDIALVKNLNTALVSKEATDEVNTMQDALDAAYEYGYTVDKLTPSSSGDIVWDEVNNRFALINEKKEVVFEDGAKPLTNDKAKIWKIVTELAEVQDYSWYVGGLSKEAIEKFTFTMGVDTGSVEADVNYVTAAEQDVTIHTAGGALTVNAKNATVSHYGTAQSVDVQAVAGESYHEYGEVLGNISVKKGHFVAESGSSAAALIVTAATATDVKIDVADNSDVKSVAATNKSVAANFSTIIQSGAQNVEVVETVIDETVYNSFAGGIGTEKSPYLIATEGQFEKINDLYAGKTERTEYTGKVYYFKQVDDIVFSRLIIINYFTGVYDGNNHSISFGKNVKYSFAYLFSIVFNETTIKNINYSLKANQAIALVCKNDWFADRVSLTLENIVIDSNGETISSAQGNFSLFNVYAMFNFSKIKYVNCVNKANVNNAGTSTGVFIGSGVKIYNSYPATVEFINCANYGNITGTSQVGVLYGNGAYVGLYDSDSETDDKLAADYAKEQFVTVDVINTGVITTNSDDGVVGLAPRSEYLNSTYQNTVGGTYIKGNYFTGKNVYVQQNGLEYKLNLDGSQDGISFKIVFNINLLDNGDGTVSNTTKYFYNIETDSTISSSNVISHKAYDLAKAKEAFGQDIESKLAFDEQGIAFYTQENDNVTYLIFRDKQIGRNPKTETPGETGVVVYVYAYNEADECIGTYRVK